MRPVRLVADTAVLLAMVLLTPACTTGLQARYDDPTDVCRSARQPLIATEAAFNRSILEGAVVGAGLGAAIGALAGGNWQSAAEGAGAGLLAGAAGGYAKARLDQAHTREQLQASVDADAGRDLQQLSSAGDALHQLIGCRNAEIAEVAAQYASKGITRQDALTRYQQIDAQMQGDDKLIAEVLGKANDRSAAYVSARAQSTSLPPEPAAPPPPPTNATVALIAEKDTVAEDQQRYRRMRDELEQRMHDIAAITG